MYCTNCGKKINEGDNYCMHCGTRLKEILEFIYLYPENQETKTCESCKSRIPVNAKYCPSCRAVKRKKANYPVILKLLILNTVMLLVAPLIFKVLSVFYLLYMFIGLLLSIYTIIHCIRGFYRNKKIFIILSILGIFGSQILFGIYLGLFFLIQ